MTRDIFDVPGEPLWKKAWINPDVPWVYGDSSNQGPRAAEPGSIAAAANAGRVIERARKEAQVNTPQNHQKPTEAEETERARKRLDFHGLRAFPRFMKEGWKQLDLGSEDKELRVYTTGGGSRTFWGIKPVGMDMMEFWEQNDPEVRRYEDNIAVTWADPLVPPPVTYEEYPVLWAGRGVNPDLTPAEPPIAEAPPPTKAARPRRQKKIPEVNPTHRVKKSKAPSPKSSKKGTRKSLADKTDAGHSRPEAQIPEEQSTAPATDEPSQSEPAATTPAPEHDPTTRAAGPAPLKRPRGRPANKANPATKLNDASTPSKRTRGRPAKAQPAAKGKDASLPKRPRPRGRPPGKGKATAVQGNARVTKPPQKENRALAPSTHGMRTRGKGTAELLQLP